MPCMLKNPILSWNGKFNQVKVHIQTENPTQFTNKKWEMRPRIGTLFFF